MTVLTAAIEPALLRDAGGAILYDAGLLQRPQSDWFDVDWWRRQGGLEPLPGGRGAALRVETHLGSCVLRHYRRGGLMARLVQDRYLWLGWERSRAFREWRLLAALHAEGHPVPRPVAARVLRAGVSYKADLLMRHIPDTRTLAERVQQADLEPALWARVGDAIGRLHAARVWHADLNAHNLLIDTRGNVHIIDFDRSRRRPLREGWVAANLARLRRSLGKVAAAADEQLEAGWLQLRTSHRKALEASR